MAISLRVLLEADGLWLNLSDEETYTIAADSFNEVAQQFRRVTVTNPFVEGSFNVLAVKENVVENLSVYVKGCDLYDLTSKIRAVTNALSQPQYRIVFESDGLQVNWNCWAADYTITMSVEYRHARHALIRAQVPRLPTENIPTPSQLVKP